MTVRGRRAGDRTRRITIERSVSQGDDYGGEGLVWTRYIEAWAAVFYGSGQERRLAAQQQASQTAIFECEWNPALATVAATDRIQFDGAIWDINDRALIGLNREIHFAATRAA